MKTWERGRVLKLWSGHFLTLSTLPVGPNLESRVFIIYLINCICARLDMLENSVMVMFCLFFSPVHLTPFIVYTAQLATVCPLTRLCARQSGKQYRGLAQTCPVFFTVYNMDLNYCTLSCHLQNFFGYQTPAHSAS